MKFFLSLFFVIHSAYASTLPVDWIVESHEKKGPPVTSVQLQGARNFLEKVLSIQEKVLLSKEDKQVQGFRFSHYITDFSVSKSGLFGLSSLKGRSAVEFGWKKKNDSKGLAEEAQVEIEGDSPRSLKLSADQIEEIAVSTGKVKSSPLLRQNIETSLMEARTIMSEVNVMDFPGWKLGGLRLDLNIGANGRVWFFSKVGAVVRIRINWKRTKVTAHGKAVAPVNGNTNRFVSKVLYDLDKIYSGGSIAGFKVKVVNIGVGVTQKGSVLGLFGSASAGFIGHLRFEPVKKSLPDTTPMTDSSLPTEDIEYVGNEESGKGMNFLFIPRNKWRDGLRKSLRLATFFASSASRFNGKWQITDMKTEFELTKSGFLGLASTSANSIIALELGKE